MYDPTSLPLSTSVAMLQERFINRELSWLAFNQRVLEEARNPKNPLLERVKYLSISADNLDEFTMVRIAGLQDQINHGIDTLSEDGLTPAEQLEKIKVAVNHLMQDQQACWLQLKKDLRADHIEMVSAEQLSGEDIDWLEGYFLENIFPALTPIAVDPAHPFPFLPNLGIAQIFSLKKPKTKKQQMAVLPFPLAIPRLISVQNKGTRYILLEDVISRFHDFLFPGFERVESGLFRIIRDSDLEVQEEAADLMRYYEKAVKQRRRGQVIRIKAMSPVSEHLKEFFAEQMQVEAQDIVEVNGMVGLSALSMLYKSHRPDLKFKPFDVRFPERIKEYGGDCFAAIHAKDIIVHHPFESFDVVVQFLRQAARDPDVISIKQTLYRTSDDSPIIEALIEAAERGKAVTALVELKARFDEEANIKWARDLERAGVQVVYGFVRLKTHAKISLIARREQGKVRSYVHFGTGNYHPMTAKVYTDLSFFTCDANLCQDAQRLFNFITGYAEPQAFKKLVAAPLNLRSSVLALIDEEVKHAQAGRPASIWAKMNALVDPQTIEALYRASQAGVQIDLVVRGICCLRPGVKNMSENIRVKSIIGRFLEHSRIFCFGAGHALPSPKAKVFIASADWMQRNFDGRVEVMVPIDNPTVHAQILDQIMVANLKDDIRSWALKSDGTYERTQQKTDFCAHDYFIHNPSLSGRGKALRKDTKKVATLVSHKKTKQKKKPKS